MEFYLTTPIPLKTLRKMKIGDIFYLTGTLITARDEAHLKTLKLYEKGEKIPVDFTGNGVFHCGPIMKQENGKWTVIAAGPTTSSRMEIFQDKFIKAFRPAVIIGKGGMGERTARACSKYGCIYGVFTGGAALLAAKGIKGTQNVFWLEELGMPECLWIYRVKKFGPMIVTIDSHGGNLTENVKNHVNKQLNIIKEKTQ